MAEQIPADLMCSADELVTLPDVAKRMLRIADDPSSDREAIGRLASWDPALTARLLAHANEAQWGQSGLIESTLRALAVLDNLMIRKLAAGLRAAENFAGIPPELATMESFWLSSVHTAVAAREIAAQGGKGRSDMVFVAGLLQGIGQLVMLQRAPPAGQDLEACKRELLSFDHARVGAALMAAWRLPDCLKVCVEYHRQPGRARAFRAEVAIVHVANSLAVLATRESDDLRDAPAITREAWATAGLTPRQGLDILPTVRQQAQQARRLFAA
jgi:HD-like signal output (HDOD) protein